MQETLNALKINQITTSFYHPQSNAKIERFHRTLHDILSKKMKDNVQTWDLYLNQALAAIRFNVSESSKFSPYFLIYNRDPVLPIDNILKPRRKYYGDQEHQIALEQQHKSFVLVHKYLKKAKKKQAKYANKNRKEVKLEVGDAVYHRNHHKHSKLNSNWKPFYRIIEKTTPVSFKIRNQLDGTITKAHAEHLRLANVDDWDIPKDNTNKPIRINPDISDSDSISSETSEDEIPLNKIAKRYRKERDNSSDEEDIPLMELSNKLKQRQRRLQHENEVNSSSDMHSDLESNNSENEMSVGEVNIKVKQKPKREQNLISVIKTLAGML